MPCPEHCDGTTTVDDMVRAFDAAHPDDTADIREDVRQTVRRLVELGLVVDGGPA
jgi:myo-inositol catabolism protein IolC